MSYQYDLVLFSSSRKNGGRCIVGKTQNDQEWIRPVSGRPGKEISPQEFKCTDGTFSDIFDIVRVEFLISQPTYRQPENHLINGDFKWIRRGRLPYQEVLNWTDNPLTLWDVGDGSLYGLNNRVYNAPLPERDLLMLIEGKSAEPEPSVYLISVPYLDLTIGLNHYKPRAVYGEFTFNRRQYRLDLTDPAVERISRENRRIENPLLCVSLGEAYTDGFSYKFIATVIFPERFE